MDITDKWWLKHVECYCSRGLCWGIYRGWSQSMNREFCFQPTSIKSPVDDGRGTSAVDQFFFSSDLSGLTPSGRHDRRTLPWCGIPNHEPSIIINHLWIIIDSCKSPVGRISTNRNWMVYGKCSIVFPQWFHNHHRISHQSSQHVLHPMVSIIFPQFSTGFPEFPWFRSLQTRLVPFFVDQGRRLGWPFEKCRSSGFFGAGRWVLDVGTLWLWLT